MKSEFLEVCFGDVFEYSQDPGQKYVVVETDDPNVFANRIQILEDGREAIVIGGGSTGYKEIGNIVDRWDLERIQRGLILGCQASFRDDSPLMDRMIEITTRDLELNAQKPPVILRPI